MAEWAERAGVNYRTLKARIRKRWPLERALDPALTEHGTRPEKEAAILAARSFGMTMRQIADREGVSVATVHRVCSEAKS